MEPWTYERLFDALDRDEVPARLDATSAARLSFSRTLLQVLEELRPSSRTAPGGDTAWSEPVDARLVPAGPAERAWRGAPTEELMRYELDEGELELTRLDDGALVGQVSDRSGAPALDGGSATLFGAEDVRFADLDERGRFAFDGVPPGEYTLLLEHEPARVVVRGIDLRGPTG